MARNKKEKRPNLPQETLERARAEMRGEIYIPDAEDFDADESVTRTAARTRIPTTPAVPSAIPGLSTARAKADRASTKPVNSPVTTTRVKRGATTARRVPLISELLGEYRYVLRDLRNLGVLAVSLLVAIIVLALIITHV